MFIQKCLPEHANSLITEEFKVLYDSITDGLKANLIPKAEDLNCFISKHSTFDTELLSKG